MKALIAEDDLIPRRMLESALRDWGYEVVATCDGNEAWDVLQRPDAAKLVILDWMMPGIDGIELCRKVRSISGPTPPYIILLTGRGNKQDIVAGLQSGANDYVTKPFDREELHARIDVGRNVVELQHNLAERVRELEIALSQVKQLQGLLPICSYCKKVRDDKNYWDQVDGYLMKHSEVKFSHGICPDCWKTEVEPQLKADGICLGDSAKPPE